ncbi:MAG: endonuclease III [Gemmatimonadaceae bacterium]
MKGKPRPVPKQPARKQSASRKRTRRFAPATGRAPEIYRRLEAEYPDATCALDHRNPYELLVATILSAQCTDRRVNMVTPALFAKYPNAEALSAANPEDLEEMIKSTGFFRNKTKSLLGMSAAVVTKHGGDVPRTMDELVKLSGVGRKTANVILGNAFGLDEGVVVDTHVSRLSNRLALSRESDPVKIEQDLMSLFPRKQWTMLSHLLISHGREVCDARRPLCEKCVVNQLCPFSRVST